MADNPNVGPDPVDAEPNHVREKTYKAPETPPRIAEEGKNLPEAETEQKIREDMPKAVDTVKKRLG